MRLLHSLAPPLVAAGLLLTGCTAPVTGPSGRAVAPTQQAAPVLDPDAVAAAVESLGSKPGKDLAPSRLAPGLVPPTNRWFSGLVFGAQPQPVFPLPLSFGVTAAGFGFGVPEVTTNEKTIMGGHAPIVQVGVPGSPSWEVTGYDELGVTLTAGSASGRLGEVRIVQGSPYVTYTAASAQSLTTNMAFTKRGDLWVADDGTDEYVVVAPGARVSATTVQVPAGGRVTWFPVPDGGSAEALAALASDPVTSGEARYGVGDTRATTTLAWRTAGGGKTAFATLPHQQADATGPTCDLGTYRSTLGTMQVCSGNELTWTAPTYPARAQLDLGRIDEATRRHLRETLAADVAASEPYPADTYFGGKALYRDAQLYTIARQVGDTERADALRKKVSDQLLLWSRPAGCDAQQPAFCFYYDETNRGIVGNTPSFGSDEFNDHHFHYGYFLYAAGVMAADDPALRDGIAPVMNLLAADIAATPGSDLFPQRRTFDAYAGHSWASGTSPFADGNNQESSSEAVNAWAGLALWAEASGNDALRTQATWLQALEAQTARAYWTDFDTNQPVYAGYGHSIVPLNFGGKRDYATWFSAEPAAALAILLLPVGPSSDHLAGDPERIARNVAEATATRGFGQQYGDYLLMYSALGGEEQRRAAWEVARGLPDEAIDDGNTRTYLLAFLASLEA